MVFMVSNFLKEDENLHKCAIENICAKETYSTSDYLSHINSIFTKLRTDALKIVAAGGTEGKSPIQIYAPTVM